MWHVINSFTNIEVPQIQTRFSTLSSYAQKMSTTQQVKLGIPVVGVFKNAYTMDTAVVRVAVKEARGKQTIRSIYSMLQTFRDEEVSSILKQYLKGDVLKRIKELKFVDLRKLASLILLLVDTLGYEVTGVGFAEDLETGKLQFISIYIDGCGWDEWKSLSRSIKKRLVEEGFDDVASRVALVCRKALRTLKD